MTWKFPPLTPPTCPKSNICHRILTFFPLEFLLCGSVMLSQRKSSGDTPSVITAAVRGDLRRLSGRFLLEQHCWAGTYFMDGPWNIDVIHSVVNYSKEFWHLRISLRHTKCNNIVHDLNTSARAIIKHTYILVKSPGISLSQPTGAILTPVLYTVGLCIQLLFLLHSGFKW